MRNFSPIALSLLIAACASAMPPEPPLPITPPAVTAADYPLNPLREVGTAQVPVQVDGTVRDTIISGPGGFPRLDRAAIDIVSRWRFKPAPKRPACPGLARRERPVRAQAIRRNFLNP